MVFSSLVFLLLFLPAILTVYFLFRDRAMRNIVLLIVSLFFYSWGEPRYVFLIMVSIVMNWGIALLLVRYTNWRRSILTMGVGINIFGLGVFKYAGFLIGNLVHVFSVNLSVPNLSLPIGISFYTFQAISYLVDVYRGQVAVQKNPFFSGLTWPCLLNSSPGR